MKFRIVSLRSINKCVGFLMDIALNLEITFGKMVIFMLSSMLSYCVNSTDS